MKKLLLMGLCLLLVAPWLKAQDADGGDKGQTNVYAIVKAGDGRLQVIKAKLVEKKDPALFITDMDDKRNARQLNMLIDIVPYYVDEDQNLPDENVQSILTQYDNLIKSYPELRKSLTVDRTKYLTIIENRKLQAEEKLKQQEKALKDFTQEQFDDATEYKLEDLNTKISTGDQLKAQFASAASQVDDYLKPWVARQTILKEGRVKFEGEWRTAKEIQEIQQGRRADRIKEFVANIKPIAVSNTVASQQTMTMVVIFLGVSALVALFCFYYAVFQSRISGFLEFIMLIVSVIFMGLYAFYAVRIFNAPGLLSEYPPAQDKNPAVVVAADAKPAAAAPEAQPGAAASAPAAEAHSELQLSKLEKLLYISKGNTLNDLKQTDLSVTLTDDEINEAIAKLVTFRQDTVSGSLGVSLEKVKFVSVGNKLRFFQQTSCLGKNFLLRYDLHFQSNDNVITYYKCDVYIGDTALPSAIGNRLWLHFYDSIQEVMKGFNITRNYQIQTVEEGKITLGYILPGTR